MRFYSYLVITLIAISTIPSLTNSQWVQTNGPYGGGYVSGLLWKDTTAVASIAQVGIYKLKAAGSAWAPVHLEWPWNGMFSLAASGTNIYVAGYSAGVLVSTNSGASWNLSSSSFNSVNAMVASVAVLGTEVFAGTNKGLFLSTDTGKNWGSITGPNDSSIGTLAISGSQVLAQTGYGNLYLSTNNGTVWAKVDSGLTTRLGFLAIVINDPDFYVGSSAGVIKSTDGGKSWSVKNNGLPQIWAPQYYVNAFAVSGNNILAAMEGAGVYLSTNGGDTWKGIGPSDPHINAISVNGLNVLAGSATNVYVSYDFGRHWSTLDAGMATTAVNSIFPSGSNLFAATNIGLFQSTSSGDSWGDPDTWIGDVAVSSMVALGSNLIAAGDNGVYLSNNSGFSWVNVSSGMIPVGVGSLAVSGSVVFAGTSLGVYMSDNLGLSWNRKNAGLSDSSVNVLQVKATNLFAGTASGVFSSTDNGTSWSPKNVGLTDKSINALAILQNVLYAGTSTGVFTSTDDGSSWNPSNNGLANSYVSCFTVSGGYIFAGSARQGVFFSRDKGLSWRPVNDGLPLSYYGLLNIASLATDGSSILCGTFNRGVWKRGLSEITMIPNLSENGLPQVTTLSQNYPNPFNPSTTIRYGLSGRSQVTLMVFNTLGQQVSTLVNEYQDAGYHDVRCDGSGLASGVYFYRLQAGSFVQTRKLLLVR